MTAGDFVTTDGVRLSFVENGSGRPLVMIPGWGTSSRWFGAQLDGLSRQLRVIALDQRFHGRSDQPTYGARVSRTAKDVRELIEVLALDDVVLLGWSIGVTTVLSYFDLFGSERISRFVMVCNGCKLLNDEQWDLGFTDLPGAVGFRTLAESDPAALAIASVPSYFVTPRSDAELGWMVADTANLPATAAALAFDAIVQDYRDVLSRLDRPTLAIFGAQDSVARIGNAELFARSIPGVRCEVFEASGHCPFIEETARFNDLLATFATA